MKGLIKAVGLLLLCFALLGTGNAEDTQVTLTVEKLTSNIYIVKGGIANTGFVVGKQEVIAIDAEMTTEMAHLMLAEIKKVTPLPVTKVIVTHSDPDHFGGLGGFPPGVEIISSANTKKELEIDFTDPKYSTLLPFLPNRTYEKKLELQLDDEEIQLFNIGPAHTSGDTIVFFPAHKLAFVGDVVFAGGEPKFHDQPTKRGRADGMINAAKQLLALDANQYISGHDPGVDSRSDLENQIKRIQEMKAEVKAMIDEGKTREDIAQAFEVIRYPNMPELIYLDLIEEESQ